MATVSVAQISALILELDKIKKLDLDPAVQKKYGDLVKKLEEHAHDLHEKVTPVEAYDKLHEAVKKVVSEVQSAQAQAKKNKGPAFKWKGEDEATEAEAIAFIKKHLPSGGHGNVSQALNDLTLGRGKSTSGASGVLHASAGPEQKGKGCTLFFKREGNVIDIVAIGQHEEVKSGQKPEYYINWSGGTPFKKDAVFKF
jgi:hypothetical protein